MTPLVSSDREVDLAQEENERDAERQDAGDHRLQCEIGQVVAA